MLKQAIVRNDISIKKKTCETQCTKITKGKSLPVQRSRLGCLNIVADYIDACSIKITDHNFINLPLNSEKKLYQDHKNTCCGLFREKRMEFN